jgi:hypothetical protein
MLLATPAIALESDELSEGAAEVHNGTIEHHEDKERKDEDHRDDCQPVLDCRPAPALGSRGAIAQSALEILQVLIVRLIVDLGVRHSFKSLLRVQDSQGTARQRLQ